MRDIITRRNLFLLASTSVLGLGLAAMPMAIDLNTAHPVLKSAWADGGEGGGEGGDSGGDGGEGGHGGDDGGHGGDDGGESGHSGDDSSDDSGESGESGNSGPGSSNSDEPELGDDSRNRP